ncbi:NRDE family protein [Pelagicoccus sp. SDUM812005]|uniref:NRDE family protein n=1 Tax=Pelagicoccus sp. SDUM812005 TaxID=3041257 RepID=UPI00280E1940|nr:NRDE family protein [Pelagicoccus sp. SDUM812005]MDQ8180196.1 NRDE family protein [Pelagicoccus sp. SDUM812005]
MCTATWSVGQGRLSLFFNRDERKTRSQARPPAVLNDGETKRIAAIDPDAGGTWLAVNEFGLCVFLLNNYGAQARGAGALGHARSRGELPLRYASCKTRAQGVEALRADSFAGRYNPFLIGLADTDGVEGFAWDGESLSPLSFGKGFVTTSSYRTAEVQAYRESRYDELRAGREYLTPAEMRELLTVPLHPDPAFNALMLRQDSRTHNLSQIEVDRGGVSFRYWPVVGESRSLGPETQVSLPRGGLARGEA